MNLIMPSVRDQFYSFLENVMVFVIDETIYLICLIKIVFARWQKILVIAYEDTFQVEDANSYN